VVMVAEKAADLIRGVGPLPPDAVPFYRRVRRSGTGGRAPSAERAAVVGDR
jgi:hypothetical protein